jgi:hypothetical protein
VGNAMWHDDYLDAYRRHWDDGELLYRADRWANADHLYGLSAECGLKAVMAALGMETERPGSISRKYQVYVNELWDEFLAFAQGKGAARYASLLPTANPFAD